MDRASDREREREKEREGGGRETHREKGGTFFFSFISWKRIRCCVLWLGPEYYGVKIVKNWI